MNIQAIFDQEVIDMLPIIKELITQSNKFEANQIRCRTIKECLNSCKALANMSLAELQEFQNKLIATFKHFEWI